MAKKEERDRNRERRKRGNSKYGQAKLKHAKKGIWSCMIAAVVVCLSISLSVMTYIADGSTAGYVGGMGMSTMLFAAMGIYMARRGFREREKDYLTRKVGLVCNSLFFILFVAIFCWGLF